MELTKQDLDILIEAVDEWVNKDFAGRMIGDLVGTLLSKDAPPEVKTEMKEKERREREGQKVAKKLREEQAIILKAKLLKMRDSVETDEFSKNG